MAAVLQSVAVFHFCLLFLLCSSVRRTVPSPTHLFLFIGMNWWIFVLFRELKLTDVNIYFVVQIVPDLVIGRTVEMATVVVYV